MAKAAKKKRPRTAKKNKEQSQRFSEDNDGNPCLCDIARFRSVLLPPVLYIEDFMSEPSTRCSEGSESILNVVSVTFYTDQQLSRGDAEEIMASGMRKISAKRWIEAQKTLSSPCSR